MIVVTVGTGERAFDRLIRAVAGLTERPLLVQHGPSPIRPAGATCVDYLRFDELVEHVRGATAVVMHAGVGSLAVAMAHGKKPIVMPRRRQYGEAVDDHQVALATRMAELGVVTLVDDASQLEAAIAAGESGRARRLETPSLAIALGSYLAEQLGAHVDDAGIAA